jgi:type I restriction enzyme S subunit
MDTKKLRQKILDLAIHGKLVAQNPNDEPASELLKRIRAEKEQLIKEGKIKKTKTTDSSHYENVPFEIPSSWEWCRLEKICLFLSRGKSPKYSESDKTYPVFAQKCNLKDGGISLEQVRFLDPSTIYKWDEIYKLRTGDVLVNSTGTGTVGRTRLFHEDCLGKYPFVVPDSHVSVVRTSKYVISEFVFAYLSSHLVQQYLEDNLAGSTNQKELYIGVLGNILFPLPPLAEQKRIVEAIDKWFALIDSIENNKADLETTIKQTKSKILDLAIHGKLVTQNPNDEPASELLKRINPKAEIISNSDKYGNLPNGWCITLYKNIVKNVNSKAYQILQSEIKVNGKYPVISQSSNYIEGYSNCTEKVFQCKEAIIFGDHTRNVKFINFPFIVGADGVKILQTQFDYKYIYYFTIFSSDNLIEDKGYSRHFGQLSSLEIPLPPLEEQKRIVEAIDKAFKYLDAIAESL